MTPKEWESKEHDGRWANLSKVPYELAWTLAVVDEPTQQTVHVRLCEQDITQLRQWLNERVPRR